MRHYKIYSMLLFFLLFQAQINVFAETMNRIACEQWVDSVINQMSSDEKIGQLFIYTVAATDNANNQAELLRAVNEHKVGGILFWKGNIKGQAALTNRAQAAAKIPLFITLDGEFGLQMRLEDALRYPRKTSLSAIRDEQLLYDLGAEIGRQCNEMGIHINFDPVLDVNMNFDNPVINTRSFGDDPKAVARKAALFVDGLRSKNIMAVGKHFPGHGDTQQDSHAELAIVKHNRATLDSVDLYPFKYLIDKKMDGMMIGHLAVPAIDQSNTPASLSAKITTNLLQEELGFKGLIFTDGMKMKAVSSIPDMSVKALLAGNDIILDVSHLAKEIGNVKKAVESGKITQKDIDEKVRKILRYKYKARLQSKPAPICLDSIELRLNNDNARVLQEKLAQKSLTLLKNEHSILPLSNSGNKIALINIGKSSYSSIFLQNLSHYDTVQVFNVLTPEDTVNNKWDAYQTLIFAIYDSKFPDAALSAMSKGKNTVQAYFISPYRLTNFTNSIQESAACLLGYESSPSIQKACAQGIFGGIDIDGQLPVSLPDIYPKGTSVPLKKSRLAYSFPETEGFNPAILQQIDSIANDAIVQGAMPGCQVLVARRGTVVYQKSFGHHRYNKVQAVKNNDLYDLASITKATSTLPLVMSLYDQGKINLNEPVSHYFCEFNTDEKKDISWLSLLTHRSGLPSFVSFYQEAIDMNSVQNKLHAYKANNIYSIKVDKNLYVNKNFRYQKDWLHKTADSTHSLQVAENMFMTNDFRPLIWQKVRETPVQEKKYVYSDLNFMLLQQLAEQISTQNLEEFTIHLFRQLGTESMGFKPRSRFDKARIVPTVKDNFLRKQLLQGFVHDENAAFLGGVSGHAGLFGNAGDLAVYFQMLLNDGRYGGKQYFSPATCRLFTAYPQSEKGSHGLGFDRREVEESPEKTGRSLFGHTGFTGSCVWVDSKEEIIYIFLSNRVHPDSWNRKLYEMKIRSKIEDVIYQALADNNRSSAEKALSNEN